MLGFLDRIGRVHRITGKGDVRVEYDLGGDQPAVVGGSTGQSVRWTLHPSCLAKVGGGFAAGQSVRVLADGDAVRTLQSGHGEWAPAMAQALGHSGKVQNCTILPNSKLSQQRKVYPLIFQSMPV